MKNTAVAFFTANSGEKLEDEINKFFTTHAFRLTNVCYGCCYDISKGKTMHNAMATYQFGVKVMEPAAAFADSYSIV